MLAILTRKNCVLLNPVQELIEIDEGRRFLFRICRRFCIITPLTFRDIRLCICEVLV